MAVLFNNIPGNIRPPLFYAEFQSGGTPYQQNARLLLVGQKLDAGNATANHPVMATDSTIGTLAGRNSMLHAMYQVARRNAPLLVIHILPLADAGAGVAATGKISVGEPTLTFAQPLTVYVQGKRVRVVVLTSDTRANIATKIKDAINATDALLVTAAINGTNTYEVDITCRHKGTVGNTIAIEAGLKEEDGPLGQTGSQCVLTLTAMANGATDPDFSTGFANLGDDEYDWIAAPYGDSTSLGYASDLLNDISGRWSYAKQIYGHYICTNRGNVAALSSLGGGRNDPHSSIFPTYKFVSPDHEVVAALGAVVAAHLQDAPELSRPLQTLQLLGIIGPRLKSDRLSLSDRQTLYYDGISGYHVRRDGTVAIDRLTTTYQTNAWGDPDWTYLDVETMAQSMYGIRYLRSLVTSTHGRQSLANDNPGRLPHIVTPTDVRNTIVHGYTKLVRDEGVFENIDAFKSRLVVERDATDVNRINVSMPVDHVNQLRIVAVAVVNHMQLERASQALAA